MSDDDIYEHAEDVSDIILQIARKGTFRRFKDVLIFYPKERERWFKFKNEKVTERVNEWGYHDQTRAFCEQAAGLA